MEAWGKACMRAYVRACACGGVGQGVRACACGCARFHWQGCIGSERDVTRETLSGLKRRPITLAPLHTPSCPVFSC
eukprot:365688-Chlamydomonas_euryale.AAC.4